MNWTERKTTPTICYEQARGNSGEEKLPLKRKEPPEEPDSEMGSHPLRLVKGAQIYIWLNIKEKMGFS